MSTTSSSARYERVYVAGHSGLAGSALVRALHARGYSNVVVRTHAELDLTDQRATRDFFARERPSRVFVAAAMVGGILANDTRPAEFLEINLAIQTNVIDGAFRAGAKRLLFLGSSCIYPRECPQPIREEYLLTGQLEKTNRSYAIAKIAGIEMCRAYNQQYGTRYIAAMPTNLYGPGDNYDLASSHVLPALIRKMHEARAGGARRVVIWGTGRPRREFLHSDDMADACVFLMELDDAAARPIFEADVPLVNVGCGEDVSILELAQMVARVVDYHGEIVTDPSKPDGTPRKLLDVSQLAALGWRARIPLVEGIRRTYETFLSEQPAVS